MRKSLRANVMPSHGLTGGSKLSLLRAGMQRTVQTVFYSSLVFGLIAVPQLVAHALGAPVAL